MTEVYSGGHLQSSSRATILGFALLGFAFVQGKSSILVAKPKIKFVNYILQAHK